MLKNCGGEGREESAFFSSRGFLRKGSSKTAKEGGDRIGQILSWFFTHLKKKKENQLQKTAPRKRLILDISGGNCWNYKN